MKTRKFVLSVEGDHIRKLVDPQENKHDSYHVYVPVKNLPLDLPMDINPRAQDTESRVARQISESLIDNWSEFHLLNRGITISAYEVEYDNKKGTLTLSFPENNDGYGIIDGGHTYAVIRKNVQPNITSPQKPDFFEAYVRLEVIVNVGEGLIVDLARARNTSAQVKDESLANLEGKFDWIKEALEKTPFANRIAYRENEDDEVHPIDIREVVSLITLFHESFLEGDLPPVMAYSSKGRCLEFFRNEENLKGYKKLEPIMVDILKLYDYIQLKFTSHYKESGGMTTLTNEDKHEKQKGVKLGKLVEVKQIKSGFPLYYLGDTAFYRFPDGWVYPILGALRCLISYKNGQAKWKVDPFKFFDKFGKQAVSLTLETSRALGRNPNAVGKNKPHWIQLYDKFEGRFAKLLGVDLDKTATIAD